MIASGIRVNRPGRLDRGVVGDDAVTALLAAGAPVALGVSGGKDSCALAFATIDHLDAIGHTGPRVLVHADLGRVEWRDSMPTCERLAAALGLELIVVRRAAGDMMDRWLSRWTANVRRYVELECVKLILPWSTPSMRFCTSELKTAVITAELVKRFPGRVIVSAAGIRREESSARSKAPISKIQNKLTSKKHATTGIDWNPIIEWTEADVRAVCSARGFDLHEGYTRYGMSRISCAFCIMGNAADLAASSSCPDNADVYREMVALELRSTFAFQGGKWLADLAPHLLPGGHVASVDRKVAAAKAAAAQREQLEARIPDHLLYTKGWPTVMPSESEAEMLCSVRCAVGELVGLDVKYKTPTTLIARYADLMSQKAAKDARGPA